jgi:hypothetical protein
VSGNHGNRDDWIVKLESNGNFVWQKCLGGSMDECINSIQITPDGGYIVAGYTTSNDGDVSGYIGGGDFWIVKLDSDRNITWQKCLGGTYIDTVNSIYQTPDGGYIAAGFTDSNDVDVVGSHGGEDYWVVKLDSAGGVIWKKCYGGSGHDVGFGMVLASDGGYAIVGNTESNNDDVTGNHGANDFWIIKLNSSGD